MKGWLVTAKSLRRNSGKSSQSGLTHLWQSNDIALTPLLVLPARAISGPGPPNAASPLKQSRPGVILEQFGVALTCAGISAS
jgi:hypothetical protein